MATPPTRVSYNTPTTNPNQTATQTTAAFAVQAGDLIVVLATGESEKATMSTPTATGGSITWTLRQSIVVTNYSTAYCWTGTVGATAASITVSVAVASGASQYSAVSATVWRNHGGVGISNKANVASGAPSVALAGCSANSAVQFVSNDWNAGATTGLTWLSINGAAMTQTIASLISSRATFYGSYRADSGAAGTVTVGMSAPTGQKYSAIGIEVLGVASASPQTCSPTGVASAEAEGAPALSAQVTTSPSGVGSAEAEGAPTLTVIPPGKTLQPVAIAGAEALGVPSLSTLISLAPVGIASLQALGQPSLTTAVALSPASIASAQALGNPALAAVVVSSPQGITSAEASGLPTLNSSVVLSPTGVTSAEGSGTPALDFRLTLAALGIASAEGLGVPALSTRVGCAPLGVPSAEALGVPSLAAQYYATALGIASAQAMGTPSLTMRVLLGPIPIGSAEAVGLPTVGGVLTLSPVGVASAAGVGVPTLHAYLLVSPQGLASRETFGVLALGSLLVVTVVGVDSEEAVGSVWITRGVIKPAHRPHGAVLPTGSGVILWNGSTRPGSIVSPGGSGSIG